MWGNIFSGLLSVAQGDSPEEILKKQAMATVMGGTAPVGVESASTIAPHLAQTGAEQAVASGMGGELASTLGGEMVTQNPALTNSMGESSNMLTQLGRDAGSAMSNTFDSVGDNLGEGMDWINDRTGLEKKDLTMMSMNHGANLLQPTPQKAPQHAPAGQGISKPQGNPPPNQGSLLSSLPSTTPTAGPGQAPIPDLSQLTQAQIRILKQQGIL